MPTRADRLPDVEFRMSQVTEPYCTLIVPGAADCVLKNPYCPMLLPAAGATPAFLHSANTGLASSAVGNGLPPLGSVTVSVRPGR
jgi:hypothetical protein